MKKALKMVLFIVALQIIVFANENNDFYDNEKTYELKTGKIMIDGEITNPGYVDFGKLKLRSLIVKEAKFKGDKVYFVCSYRYDGYSLFDILKERYIDKKNKKEFESVIDLLVIIENN